MDWNIGWVFWIGCSYFLTIVNCYFVLVKKAKYNYIIGVSGIAFFSVALLEELRMFSQWIDEYMKRHLEIKLISSIVTKAETG